MFISPGEIERGQWLMVHSSKTNDKEYNDNPETMNPLAGLFMVSNNSDQPIPHLVLSVQLPFVAVADCTMSPAQSKVWRTDEKNFVEVTDDFVKALDINCWHRGQRLLNPNYIVPLPPMPPVKKSSPFSHGGLFSGK